MGFAASSSCCFVCQSPSEIKLLTQVDIWGLGCCLYFMLVGRLPFESDPMDDPLAAIGGGAESEVTLKQAILRGNFRPSSHLKFKIQPKQMALHACRGEAIQLDCEPL